jgi:gamma-glutamyltranspeptidase / glutathione hydrolase
MRFLRGFCVAAISVAIFLPAPLYAQTSVAQPRYGMVAAEEAKAAKIGLDVLKAGGNAVDAAAAVGFALAVTWPEAGNLGGGGFMLVYLAKEKRTIAIDYRETAPAATTRDIFLNEKGEADPDKSRASGLGVGVPGTVAGLALAHRKYGSGKFTLAQLIQPAIRLAREGFEVDAQLATSILQGQPRIAKYPSSAKIFLKTNGQPLTKGDRLQQGDLANTLQEIALTGPFAFYEGPIADRIAASARGAGGRMAAQDLARYAPREREPVRGSYRGHAVHSMPPPSSGGVHLVQILNILEGYDLKKLGAGSPETAHLMIEAMKPAYADRSEFLGDPDSVKVPLRGLTSKQYAASLRKEISAERSRSAAEIKPGAAPRYESPQTTHFSVLDREGNAVANTYTLNFNWGLGLVAEETGVLLNNELDDFAAKPGVPNAFGLVGGDANAPAPGKRPLSSMSPTIVLKDDKVFLVTGAAGGSRIITTVLQTIVNVIDHGLDIDKAVNSPRVHHQWLPDEVNVEAGAPEAFRKSLEAKRHLLSERRVGGSANSIVWDSGRMSGTVDARTGGAVAGE